MRKIALVDLDDTIFDIKKFKEAYFRFLQGLGHFASVVESTYQEAKSKGYYDADTHCRLLKESFHRTSLIKEKIQEWFDRNDNLLQQLVFSDVDLFLRLLNHHNYEIHILTLGTEWFQKANIEGAGLLQYISGYIVTQDLTKCDAISQLCNPATDEVVLFDDSKKVIDAVKLIFPRITAIQVLREDNPAKVSSNADAIAKNLEEAIGAVLSRPR